MSVKITKDTEVGGKIMMVTSKRLKDHFLAGDGKELINR